MLETNLITEAEINNTKTTTISGFDLMEHIYKGESLPQDKRFLSLDEGGVFKYLDLEVLIRDPNSSFFSVLESGGKIIGLSELRKNPKDEKNFWLTFMSIDPKYQGKGYSHKLIEEIFNFSEKHANSLTLSIYSLEGREKVKKSIEERSKSSFIKIIDSNKRFL